MRSEAPAAWPLFSLFTPIVSTRQSGRLPQCARCQEIEEWIKYNKKESGSAEIHRRAVCSQSARGASRTTPAYVCDEVLFLLKVSLAIGFKSLANARDAVAVDGKWIWNSISRLDTLHFVYICDAWNKFKCLRHVCSATYHYQQQPAAITRSTHTLICVIGWSKKPNEAIANEQSRRFVAVLRIIILGGDKLGCKSDLVIKNKVVGHKIKFYGVRGCIMVGSICRISNSGPMTNCWRLMNLEFFNVFSASSYLQNNYFFNLSSIY